MHKNGADFRCSVETSFMRGFMHVQHRGLGMGCFVGLQLHEQMLSCTVTQPEIRDFAFI
jgi:hypothetical protein